MSIPPPPAAPRRSTLVVSVGPHSCAIPLEHVVETMRPLPVETIAGAPTFVLGLSVIRGVPVPVVDLAAILGLEPSRSTRRFVVLGLTPRRVAVAVDGVLGVRQVDLTTTDAIPPLLRTANVEAVAAVGQLDEHLLFVLEASGILPEGLPRATSSAQAPA